MKDALSPMHKCKTKETVEDQLAPRRGKNMAENMAEKKVVSPQSPPELEETSSRLTVETFLRVVPMGLCLAALVLMIKNSESTEYGDVSYSNFSCLRYMIYANGIGAGYSFISAFYTAMPGSQPMPFRRIWAIFLFDQVLTYVILVAATVAVEVLYLAKKGDIAVSWSEACEGFAGFCDKTTASVGVTFAAVACYVILSIISSYRLFSCYDPPSVSSPFASTKGGGIEAA